MSRASPPVSWIVTVKEVRKSYSKVETVLSAFVTLYCTPVGPLAVAGSGVLVSVTSKVGVDEVGALQADSQAPLTSDRASGRLFSCGLLLEVQNVVPTANLNAWGG